MNKTALKRQRALAEVLKANIIGIKGQPCRCEGTRWLCNEGEEPPAVCWSCGGANPPGRILRFEVIEPPVRSENAPCAR